MPVQRYGNAIPVNQPTHRQITASSYSLFVGGVIRLDEANPSVPVPRIWLGIYSGKLTLLVGESGAGKSSLFRLLCLHATRNAPLWDIHFGLGRPLKVLYVDPENMGDASIGDGGLTASRMDDLGLGRPANLFLHNGLLSTGEALNLSNPNHLEELAAYVKAQDIDLVILDPYAVLFHVENENDNATATRNMTALKDVARKTNCAFVLCHHTGKIGEEHSANAKYGRGASALLAAADVGITFRLKSGTNQEGGDDSGISPTDRNDCVRLKIEKNRVGYDYDSIFLQMVGKGMFQRVTAKEFKNGGNTGIRDSKREGQEAQARQIILTRLEDWEQHDRSELLSLTKAKGISEKNAVTSLNQLVEEKALTVEKTSHNKLLYRRLKDNPIYFAASATPDGPRYSGNWKTHPEPKVSG